MMKTQIIISAIVSLSINVSAQYLDYMGMPTDKAHVAELQLNNRDASTEVEQAEIVNVFASPCPYTADICFDGELIWINGYNEYMLYGMDPQSGQIVETIAISIQRPYGMTYSNGVIYTINNATKTIVGIDRNTGAEVYTKVLQQDNTYPTGLEISGSSIWYNDAISPNAYVTGDITRNIVCDTNCMVEYPAVGQYPSGITSQDDYFWCTDNITQTIHRISKDNFASDRMIAAPGGVYPNGLTFDGEYLWVANNSSDSIYQIRITQHIDTQVGTISEKISKVYPTIANENITIQIGSIIGQVASVQIVDMKGQILDTWTQNANTVTVLNTHFETGSYICQIITNKEFINHKFIIKH